MESEFQIIGVIKEVVYRRRATPESPYQRCDFILENGVKVICSWQYPQVRRGYKVKVIGDWSDEETFFAKSVVRINPQTKLDTFVNFKKHKREVKEK